MSINIKTSTGLKEVGSNVTKNKVISALSYTPADKKDLDEHLLDQDNHVSTLEKENWNAKAEKTELIAHLANKDNPHNITAEQIGLGNIADDNDSGDFIISDDNGNIGFKVLNNKDNTSTTCVQKLEAQAIAIDGIEITEFINARIPEFVESDPTVPDWAKATNKPKYTPEEIGLGAIEDDGSGDLVIADINGHIGFKVEHNSTDNTSTTYVHTLDAKAVLVDGKPISANDHTHAITANASDDDVVVLSGTGGTNTVTYTVSHSNSGVTAGTYKSVTVNAKGHVTGGSNPTTLAEFGITDAVSNTRKVNGKALSSDIILSADDISGVVTQTNLNGLKSELSNAITSEADSFNIADEAGNIVTAAGGYGINSVDFLVDNKSIIQKLNYTLSEDGTYYICSGFTAEMNSHNGVLVDLVIPEMHNGLPVRAIAEDAFAECTMLRSVNASNSYINSIGGGAFAGCSSLEHLTLPFVGTSANATGAYALFGTLFGSYDYGNCAYTVQSLNGYSYIYYIPVSLKSVIITDGTSIPNGAFSGCNRLESISLPATLTAIGNDAFYSCSSLKSISLPSGIITIGSGAFFNCTRLIEVIMPNTVTSIGTVGGSGVFAYCTSLRNIKLSDSLVTMFGPVFQQCSALEKVVIPNGVNTLYTNAFKGCTNLKSVYIPAGVTTVANEVFDGCTNVTILCEASSKPATCYDTTINSDLRPVYYGIVEIPETGVAATAHQFVAPRKVQLLGALVGTAYFDGSDDLILDTKLNGTTSTTLFGARWTADTRSCFALDSSFKIALNFAIETGDVFTGIEISKESYSDLGSQYKLNYIKSSGDKVVVCTATPHEKLPLPNKPQMLGDCYYVYTWGSSAYQQLYISGGADAAAPKAIEWLKSNGTLLFAESATLGPWHISEAGLAETSTSSVLSPTAINLPHASSTLQVSNVSVAKNSITGGYDPFTFGTASKSTILTLDTASVSEHYTITFTSSGWNLIGNKKDITMKLSPTPVSNFTIIVYWNCVSPGASSNPKTPGETQINITAGVASYDFSLSNDKLKTNAFGDDYLGLGAASTAESDTKKSLAELRASAMADQRLYHVDQSTSVTLDYDVVPFSNSSQGIIACSGDVKPTTSDYYSLGASNARWKAIYSQTTTIQTSDKNQKNTIQPLTTTHEQIFDALKPVSYKFNQNDSDRTHTGFLAQDIKEAVLAAGLTTKDFAAYCEWEETDGTTGCGLRYDELLALCVNEIQKLKQKVAELEGKS